MMHLDPRSVKCQACSAQPGWEEDDKHRETTLPMQKLHSKKSDWSYAQDTSNGDSVQWRNLVLQSQTAYGGKNLIFTLINLILN
jgi:hypothetical protein